MNKMGGNSPPPPTFSFPEGWEEEKGDNENIANKPAVKSSPRAVISWTEDVKIINKSLNCLQIWEIFYRVVQLW